MIQAKKRHDMKVALEKAMDLLDRVVSAETPAPDPKWFREYFLLTGQHMICTEEGWEDGSAKQSYIDSNDGDASIILDEVNAPLSVEDRMVLDA